MYFRGDAGNGPEHLYIALEDGAGKVGVLTHADPEAMRATRWTEWKVPLNAFSDAGVNVTAVKKMAIGLGDRDAPMPGGAGRLYVDDIRVTRSEPGQ